MADDSEETIVEIETDRPRRPDGPMGFFYDRRHVSVPAVIAIITLILQLGAIVWGAASLKAAVDNLGAAAGEVKSDVHALQGDVNSLKVDVAILKTRSDK